MLKGEPCATAGTILSWCTPYERIFNSLVFATVAHSALISLAIARPY